MRLHVRPTLAMFATVILVLGLRNTLGFWSPLAFIFAMLTLAMAFAATTLPDCDLTSRLRRRDGRPFGLIATLVSGREDNRDRGLPRLDVTDFLLMNIALLTVGLNVVSTGLSFAGDNHIKRHLVSIAFAGLVVYLTFLILFHRVILSPRPEPVAMVPFCVLFAVTLLLGFAFRGIVLYASPDPVIDVYSLARDNADHLLHGRNPYQSDIVTPYDTERAYSHGLFEPEDPRPAAYPPHYFLAAFPFRLFGGDARWPNVIGDTLAAVAIFGVGMKRRRPMTAYLAATTWLFVPRSAFVLENAWFEPMIGGLFGVGLWLTEYRGARTWIGYVLLGLGLTCKQFGLPLLPALLWPHRRNWKPILAGLFAGGLLMLPFFLWSRSDFIDVVLKKHLARPPQYHSITIASAFFHLGVRDAIPESDAKAAAEVEKKSGPAVPDRRILWFAAIVLIGIVTIRAPKNGAATAVALGTALMIFSTFHTQGFPNYFYLVEYLWLLGAVGLLPPAQPAQTAPARGE